MLKDDNKYRKFTGWIISSFFIFLVLLVYQQKDFRYDCGSYWKMAASFWTEEGFSINPVTTDTLFASRGYVFPFILFLLKGFWKFGWGGFWLLLSMLYGFFFSVLCGDFFELLFDLKLSVVKRIIPTICIILFWKGAVYYPLSDLMAVGLEVTGIYLLLVIKKKIKFVKRVKFISKVFLIGVSAGALLYATYNSRPVYQYMVYLAILLVFVEKRKEFRIMFLKNIVTVLGVLTGICLFAAPQIKINQENLGIASWKVPLQLNSSYGDLNNLLFQGFILQRYETNVADYVDSSRMYSYDEVSGQIMNQVANKQDGIEDYIKIWLKYPFECIGIYFGHLINAFDVRYSDVYISDISETNTIYVICSLGILYFVLLLVKQKLCDKNIHMCSFWEKGVWLLVWNLPSLVALLNDIEPRYFIGTWIFIYCMFAFLIDYKRLLREFREHPFAHTAGFLVLIGVCFYVWDITYANMTYAEYIFKR